MKNSLLKYIKIIGLGVLIGIAIAALLFGVKIYLHGKLLPGTVVSGINLGYQTRQDAVNVLKSAEAGYFLKPLVFELEMNGVKKEVQILPQEIDLKYFPEDTIDVVSKIDFKSNALPFAFSSTVKNYSTNILYTFDQLKLSDLLTDRFGLKDLAPKNASYKLNAKGQIEVTPEKEGVLLDLGAKMPDVKDSLAKFQEVREVLTVTNVLPTVKKESLEEKKDEMSAKLKKKIKITYSGKKWTFSPVERIDQIVFARTDKVDVPFFGSVEVQNQDGGDGEVYAFLDEEKFNQYVEAEIAPAVEIKTEPVSISRDPVTQEVKFEGRGIDGVKIQRGSLRKALELAVNNSVAEVVMVVEKESAPVTISEDLQAIGIKELIGTGHTTFYGSSTNRIHNIGVGMTRFNGGIIAPGEEFSFNTRLGRVDNTTGYRKELTITEKGTIPEYGGGLCQVSSTMYRAAIFTGLPITARAPHSYAVSYYAQVLGYGMDATIYLGGQDLKFINDTGANILVQSLAYDGQAYIKFYGTSDGRTVRMEGPFISNNHSASADPVFVVDPTLAPGAKTQIESRHPGLDALWYRYVTKADGTEIKETITSRYRATENKYLIGPTQ